MCTDEARPVCAGPNEKCFRDPRCLPDSADPYSGIGCNAGGRGIECRFCGFGPFLAAGIECPVLAESRAVQLQIGLDVNRTMDEITPARMDEMAGVMKETLGCMPPSCVVSLSAIPLQPKRATQLKFGLAVGAEISDLNNDQSFFVSALRQELSCEQVKGCALFLSPLGGSVVLLVTVVVNRDDLLQHDVTVGAVQAWTSRMRAITESSVAEAASGASGASDASGELSSGADDGSNTSSVPTLEIGGVPLAIEAVLNLTEQITVQANTAQTRLQITVTIFDDAVPTQAIPLPSTGGSLLSTPNASGGVNASGVVNGTNPILLTSPTVAPVAFALQAFLNLGSAQISATLSEGVLSSSWSADHTIASRAVAPPQNPPPPPPPLPMPPSPLHPPSVPLVCSETQADTVCAGPTEYCYHDPRCTGGSATPDPHGGLGCNAGGVHPECRFCGFGPFENIPCPGILPQTGQASLTTETGDASSLIIIIGGTLLVLC